MKRHIRKHSGEKSFICKNFEYSSALGENLKRHTLKHSGVKYFGCKQCKLTFTTFVALNRHVCTHSGEKPFKCEQCFFFCAQASYLQRHTRKHSNQGDFSFAHKNNLEYLMLSHTDERPHLCKKCNYTSKNFGAMKNTRRAMNL